MRRELGIAEEPDEHLGSMDEADPFTTNLCAASSLQSLIDPGPLYVSLCARPAATVVPCLCIGSLYQPTLYPGTLASMCVHHWRARGTLGANGTAQWHVLVATLSSVRCGAGDRLM